MSRMGWGMVVVASLASAAAFAADDEKVAAEHKLFEGTWQLVSAIRDGKETPAEVTQKIQVTIKDGKHSVRFGDETVVKEIPFTIDVTKTPKQTTDKLPDGKEIHGIYKIEGDTLTSCVAEVGKERPKEFASTPGSGHTLRVFKRVKP